MGLQPGATLGPYEILSLIGAGGMGEVYLAREQGLGRRVALKVLPPEFTHDAHRIARFEQEARSASALSHPNICTIFALGELPNGRHFIAMEYIDGQTLRHRLKADRLSLMAALDISSQIAAGVSAAHALGIVHRDLKPENVIIRQDGLVKVVDFGLAKLTHADDVEGCGTTHLHAQTDPGSAVGTIAYMSPEQARAQEVDIRTDIWSLGVLLYEMVAGRSPFAATSSSDMLAAILERDPPPLARFDPDAPGEFQRIVSKALRKDRERRYQTMKDLFLDLDGLRDELARQAHVGSGPSEAVTANLQSLEPTPSEPEQVTLQAKVERFKAIAIAAVLVAIAALAGSGWWWAMHGPNTRTSGAAPHVVPRNLTRLTFDFGLQTDVTWSPDGRSVAYASDKAGNFDIWAQRVDGGDALQLTRSREQDTRPTWSPDGGTIVFQSGRDGGGLFAVPATGGAERRLTSFGVRPKWAPDGSKILFASTDNIPAVPQLFTVGMDGKAPEQVLQPFLKQLLGVYSWNWYPDSHRVSVLANTENLVGPPSMTGFGIYTVPLAGGPPKLVKYTPELGSWNAFEWTSSGTTLYVDCDSYGARNIGKFTVDPQAMTILRAERVTAGDNWEPRLAASADARQLAFATSKMSLRLWAFPFDGVTGRISGNGEPVTDSAARVGASDLAADGAKLVYHLTRTGSPREELWTTDLTTGQSRLLANDDQFRDSPQWSRDGGQLVYSWNRRQKELVAEQALAVRRMDISSDEQLIMTPQKHQTHAADPRLSTRVVLPFNWSPDGGSVLASTFVPESASVGLTLWPLAAAPHAETAVKVLASDTNRELWQGRFSPDGRWIAFVGTGQGGRDCIVFVIPSAGAERSGWTSVTAAGLWADKPRWSPDGKLIYFILRQGSFFNLWAVRFDAAQGKPIGAPFQITHFDSARREISPDLSFAEVGVSAKRLILTIMEQTGNIWMLDNVDR